MRILKLKRQKDVFFTASVNSTKSSEKAFKLFGEAHKVHLHARGCAKTISLCEGKWQFSAGSNHLYYYLDVMY